MAKRTWSNQFTINEDTPLSMPSWLLERPWEDYSWGNEVCPRFINPDLALSIWVDYDQPEDREMDISGWKKFNINRVLNIEEDVLADETLFSSDSEEEVKQYIHNYAKSLHSTAVLDGLNALLSLCDSEEESELVRGMLDDLALLTEL